MMHTCAHVRRTAVLVAPWSRPVSFSLALVRVLPQGPAGARETRAEFADSLCAAVVAHPMANGDKCTAVAALQAASALQRL